MSNLVREVTFARSAKKSYPEFKSGDTVSVHVRVKEGEKERIQVFKGVVIRVSGSGMGRSFTVRKISSGVGVERIFPFASPSVDHVELISHGKVRRNRLYFLRGLKGRAARLVSNMVREGEDQSASEGLAAAASETETSKEASKTTNA